MKKVLLLLANGFEIFEASAFIDVIGWNLAEGDNSTQLYSCGLKKEIKSSFDQKFVVDYLIDDIEINDFDALAIPGGFEIYDYYKDAYDNKFLDLIRSFRAKGKIIATICVGALPLAKSGVLESKNGTTYNSLVRRQALKEFGVNVINQPLVFEDNMITSCGPSTAVTVALLLLESLTTKANSDKVRKLMGF